MNIKIKDIDISQFRYLGQGIEKSRVSVRVKHLPTGTVVDSESEATKGLNYKKAFYELMEKLDDKDNFINPETGEKFNITNFRTKLSLDKIIYTDMRGNVLQDGETDLVPISQVEKPEVISILTPTKRRIH